MSEGDVQWSAVEARVLGALIEKGLATPQNYPLSLNALTAACNQTTNRDPVMTLAEREVEQVVTECKAKGVARLVHPRSGRGVTKFRHVVDEALRIDDAGLALLNVLLLRGPQTVGELRTRTERLHGFADNAEIESLLETLAGLDGRPLVRRLEREPGHRERRWIQLLCPEQGVERIGGATGAAGPEIAAHPVGAHADDAADVAAAEPWAHDASNPVGDGNADLRSEVEHLRRELSALRAEFEAFRAEFG